MLQNNPELKSKIDQLWNKFWSGGISNPLTAIEQITYLLFMKRLDELDQKRQADAEWTGENYISKFTGTWIPPEYRSQPEPEKFAIDKRSLRWSEFKRMQAEDMLQHVQSKVFPFLKDLNGAESNFTHHMKNAVFIIPKPALLVEAVKTIDDIFEVMEKDSKEKGQAFQDIQGDVYEFLLSEIATAGKNGQFRTPRHIIKLVADLVQPQLGHKIADPVQTLCRGQHRHSAVHQGLGAERQGEQSRHRTRLVLRNDRRRLFAGRQAEQAGRLWRPARHHW